MAQDLVEYIQHNSVECLNQHVEDDDLADSLLRQVQKEEGSIEVEQKSGKIQSHEDDPQLLIKIPFTTQVKIQNIKLKLVSIDTIPTTIKVYADLPNMDFSDVDQPHLVQSSISPNEKVLTEGITLSINPFKSQMKSVALFLDNPERKYVAILDVTVFGTPILSKGAEPRQKGGKPFSSSETITAFIRNNVDIQSNQTVMERQRVDLHALRVPEALMVLQHLAKKCRESHVPFLDVVTGKGLHSTDGIAKIKPAIEGWLVSNRFEKIALSVLEFASAHRTHSSAFCENPANSGIIRIFFSPVPPK